MTIQSRAAGISGLLIFFSGAFSACGDEAEVITPKKVVRFFQGDKIEGLYTWLQRSKYKDPDNVLTIKDGVLHFSGDGNGYLCTKTHYRDFHLTVEYRWGEATYGDRKTMARSSGVFLHGHSPDGAYEGQYMSGLECQITRRPDTRASKGLSRVSSPKDGSKSRREWHWLCQCCSSSPPSSAKSPHLTAETTPSNTSRTGSHLERKHHKPNRNRKPPSSQRDAEGNVSLILSALFSPLRG